MLEAATLALAILLRDAAGCSATAGLSDEMSIMSEWSDEPNTLSQFGVRALDVAAASSSSTAEKWVALRAGIDCAAAFRLTASSWPDLWKEREWGEEDPPSSEVERGDSLLLVRLGGESKSSAVLYCAPR